MNSNMRSFAIWVLILLLLVALFHMFQGPSTGQRAGTDVPYSDFVQAVESGQVAEVTITGRRIQGVYRGDKTGAFKTVEPGDTKLVDRLLSKGVKVQGRTGEEDVSWITSMLANWLPIILVIGVWLFVMRQMQSGSGRAMGFGKSKAKLLTERHGRVTFDDVAGVDEAKSDLQEIVEFLRDPQKFQRLGGRIPRGALLVGPPGTGKTLIARAVAGEANVPFFTISGSDFVEMFVGVGASRVRDMFEQAKKNSPCIIFIDEIDAVGRHRGAGLGGGNDEREQTLNQLLVEMDGFEANEGVIILAATNRPDVLDPALLRPGRFDRQVVVPNPDVNGRERILKVHSKKVPLAPDVDLRTIARGTPGFSGADLANLVNEAALLAARRAKRMVTHAELEDAKDKVMMGAERRSMAMSDEEKRLTAYHEAGHAVVGLRVPAGIPVHKATIIPRGRALGMVKFLPEGDRYSMKFKEYTSQLAVAMGGRVAEELVFGRDEVTSGAVSDIDQATRMARAMVTRMGFSDQLGMVAYGENQEEVFLGMSMGKQQNVSEATAQTIDSEVRRLVETGYKDATRIIKDNYDAFVRVAEALLEYETLTGDEIKEIMAGRAIIRTRDDDENRGATGPAVPVAGVRKTPPRAEPDVGGLTPQPST